MIFNIVLIPLCVTQHSGRNTSGRGCCPRTVKDWIGHFNFSFTDSIAECCVDAAVTSCVAAAAILGAWLLRARVLTLSLAAQALLVSLSLATTLSPAVILRFVLLAVGLQLRASMMRWIPLSHPPFFKQLWQETKTLVHSARSACRRLLARCWNMSNSRRQSGSSSRNVESHPIGRSSVTLQLGGETHYSRLVTRHKVTRCMLCRPNGSSCGIAAMAPWIVTVRLSRPPPVQSSRSMQTGDDQ